MRVGFSHKNIDIDRYWHELDGPVLAGTSGTGTGMN